jgi:hypothetical protein
MRSGFLGIRLVKTGLFDFMHLGPRLALEIRYDDL